jgi:hypothetical protein
MTTRNRRALPLEFLPETAHDLVIETEDDGSLSLSTTGPDPYVCTADLGSDFDPDHHRVLAFEFFSPTGLDAVQVFLGPDISEARSVTSESLTMSEGWSGFAVALDSGAAVWDREVTALRIDFGTQPGRSLRLRNPVLRAPTPREQELAAGREERRVAEQAREDRLYEYLSRRFPCRVEAVDVGDERIRVRFVRNGESGEVRLGEFPLHTDVTAPEGLETLALPDTGDVVTLDRFVHLPDRVYDRLLSRFALVRRSGNGWELLSHARYADTVAAPWEGLDPTPVRRKGLGGVSFRKAPLTDLDDLGIAAVTVNIWLTSLVRSVGGPETLAHELNGRLYYLDRARVEELDRTLSYAAERGIVVSAIILIDKPERIEDPALRQAFAHPDCHPSGIYSMANTTTEAGVEFYAAALDFLARRYGGPDPRHGRIHHWIAHNEVDAGWVWTNCGDKPPTVYMELYHKSMRVMHLIARKYNPKAQVFVSLTHYWNWTADPHFYLPRDLLGALLAFSRAEGDFDWGIAQHPYPESLFEPRTWQDAKCEFRFETPLITYRNLEVLDAWVRRRETFFLGQTPRRLHLTEQGLNSPDYSEDALADQAAGMAYAWRKLQVLDTVEAFQYHNWVDSEGEGGLRIGLRRFYDDSPAAGERKPVWFLYQALETPDEDGAVSFALDRIGIRDWEEVRYRGEIGGEPLPEKWRFVAKL